MDFEWRQEPPVIVLEKEDARRVVEAHDLRWASNGPDPGDPEQRRLLRGAPYLIAKSELDRLNLPRRRGRPRKAATNQPRSYFPCSLEYAGLHRIFADVPLSPDGARTFAEKYGLLGIPISPTLHMERYNDWSELIHWMRTSVQAIDALRRGDSTFFEERIDWGDSSRLPEFWGIPAGDTCKRHPITVRVPFGKGLLELWHVSAETEDVLRPFQERDALGAGAIAILEIIQGFFTDYTRGGLILKKVPSNDVTQMDDFVSQSVRPVNLLGALWVNLAAEMEGGREFKKCKRAARCGEWFLVGGTDRRGNAVYCSEKCQTRARDERKYLRRRESRRSGGI